jgi:hypothetical protein
MSLIAAVTDDDLFEQAFAPFSANDHGHAAR